MGLGDREHRIDILGGFFGFVGGDTRCGSAEQRIKIIGFVFERVRVCRFGFGLVAGEALDIAQHRPRAAVLFLELERFFELRPGLREISLCACAFRQAPVSRNVAVVNVD